MKLISNHKDKLKIELQAFYYASKNPDTPFISKFLIIFTLGYALSPIDLIPDFIPVIGYLDDIILIPLLIFLSVKLIPEEILEESRKLAIEKPVSLKKNWKSGIFIVLIWIVLLFYLSFKIYESFFDSV